MSNSSSIFQTILMGLIALIFVLGGARMVLSRWCRETSVRGHAITHEVPEFLTRPERWYMWVRHRTADVTFAIMLLGLVYFVVKPELDFFHYLVAFLVVPKIFGQALEGTQSILREGEVVKFLDDTEAAKRSADRLETRRLIEGAREGLRRADLETERNLTPTERERIDRLPPEDRKGAIGFLTLAKAMKAQKDKEPGG